MLQLNYRIVNVFAEQQFGGNPLCVVEAADALSERSMQALALQFNLSETVFLQQAADVDARLRIFTPQTEMAFAGHPSLGAAAVLADSRNAATRLRLGCRAGVVAAGLQDGIWWLDTPQPPVYRACDADPAELLAALGVSEEDLADRMQWISTGSDQVLVPLRSVQVLRAMQPDAQLFGRVWPLSSLGRKTVCVFAPLDSADAASDCSSFELRYWFISAGGALLEDPATGSAAANIGAWLLAQPGRLPSRVLLHQGQARGRPSLLYLGLQRQQLVRLGGKVREIARGQIRIDENL